MSGIYKLRGTFFFLVDSLSLSQCICLQFTPCQVCVIKDGEVVCDAAAGTCAIINVYFRDEYPLTPLHRLVCPFWQDPWTSSI